MIKISKKFIILLCLSFLLALAGGGNLPYYLFYSLLYVLAAALVYINIIKHFLDANVVFRRDYYSAGDTAECITQINCDAALPVPYIEISSNAFINSGTGYEGEISNITLEENRWIRNNVTFLTRGIYDIGKINLKVMDLFQITSLYKEIDADIKIKVYPKLQYIRLVHFVGKDIYLETVDKNGSNEDQFQIKDVRKYRMGDSLKKIHWKVSAKHDELYVKNSENISGEEAALFVDMAKSNFSYNDHGLVEESIIDLSVSIVQYIRSRDMNVKVFLSSASPATFNISSREEFNNLQEYLIEQKSDGSIPIQDFLFQNSYRIHKMNRILVVTADINEELFKNMIALKGSGYLISVYYCHNSEASLQYKNLLEKWGIECSHAEDIINRSRGV